jgi:hypothetical protein
MLWHSQISFYYNPGNWVSDHWIKPSHLTTMGNRMWLNHKPRMLYIRGWSRNNVIGIVTTLSARYFGVRISEGARRFFSSPVCTDRLQGPPILLLNRNWNSIPVVNRPELDVSRSPPSSSEVKNEWSYTFTPLYTFTAYKHITLRVHRNVSPLPWNKQVFFRRN